ncbi:nucleic acid/nucleotide deaminase domain-containing protein, partial [Streptomyces sp. 7R007]
DKNKKGNCAAARLDDGAIIIGRSSAYMYAEEDLLQQAGGRKIKDLYSEREPCANKCEKLVEEMNVTYSVRWNGVDRDASNAELKKLISQLFASP